MQVRAGDTIVYNDGRLGHCDVRAVVLDVGPEVMTVQFEDRADTTRIRLADRDWMQHLRCDTMPDTGYSV